MDVSQPLTAERILATYDAAELVRIFKEYGEERFSRQIARAIVARRDKEPFTTTAQLNRLVDEVVPQAHRPAGNPAKRVFQALRIEVNGELDKLASTLPQAANRLHVGGRLVVESYHSLEDKTVKSFMAQGLRVDVPAGLPVIPPDAQPFFTDLTRGAIKADEHEIAANPRSASVRLRAVEVSREIPSRWRKRFTQTAQGLNDVKIQGSASPAEPKTRHEFVQGGDNGIWQLHVAFDRTRLQPRTDRTPSISPPPDLSCGWSPTRVETSRAMSSDGSSNGPEQEAHRWCTWPLQ